MFEPSIMGEPLSDYEAPLQAHFSPHEFKGG